MVGLLIVFTENVLQIIVDLGDGIRNLFSSTMGATFSEYAEFSLFLTHSVMSIDPFFGHLLSHILFVGPFAAVV